MNRQNIEATIRQNLGQLPVEELRIQPDGEGWRIAVVSSGFVQRTYAERRELALVDLEKLTIEWLDLLTPEEREWAGKLPLDDIDTLPTWPDALARNQNVPEPVLFPSDLDDDLDPPIVVTFYSLRGGVGRSTALAYTARILARQQRTVLCLDMDLEAPGLAALFGKAGEVKPDQGLVSILFDLDHGAEPDINNHVLRISETDELYCLPAGLPNADYARKLSFLDTEAWYREEENPLRQLLQILSHGLSFKPDIILLDARTGIAPLNAPLLFDLADLAIITFFPHPQAQQGTEALVKAMLRSKTRRPERRFTPEPRFLVSPVPASKAPEIIERYQKRSLSWIHEWLSELSEIRSESEEIRESEITHFVPYREAIATSDKVLQDRQVWQDFEPIAEWVDTFLPTRSEREIQASIADSDEQKIAILNELAFATGTAEKQGSIVDNFISTELFERALQPKMPLVIGRKGTGKTAIFRRIHEGEQRPSVIVMSPDLKDKKYWVPSASGLQSISDFLQKNSLAWREFWLLQFCLSCYFSHPEVFPVEEELQAIVMRDLRKEVTLVKAIKEILLIEDSRLLIQDWFREIDRSASQDTILLFDGLDTGFGSEAADRRRRKIALEGLLTVVLAFTDILSHLRFKLLLREDIWKTLEFENKSHFHGRSARLEWSTQTELYKVVLKQAIRSKKFCQFVASVLPPQLIENPDYWSETQVRAAWNLLVGERMRGQKSGFTRNWVWNRLADGNNNHNPRSLLQLFSTALAWEKQEQKKNAYSRALIRPRALTESLNEVSEKALNALIQEEFRELQDLANRLTEIGSTPLEVDKLKGHEENLELAKEVGLLTAYEKDADDVVKRYKVPDLYRLGLKMRRQGQA